MIYILSKAANKWLYLVYVNKVFIVKKSHNCNPAPSFGIPTKSSFKMISYIFQSIKTFSYWRYAILSKDGVTAFFANLGVVWLIFEIGEKFKLISSDSLPPHTLYVLLIISLLIVIFTRRPITKIGYKLHGVDLSIEVRIGDMFSYKGQKIISTNTTFDTDIANGIISENSLQGQFTKMYFPQNIGELDQKIDHSLSGISSVPYPKNGGKQQKYPMGTTVRINIANEVFYLTAMSDLNQNNTASTTFDNVMHAVSSVFEFIAQKGENTDIIIPVMGTGRGRITTNRNRVIARIAQSFIRHSDQNIFSSKLIIVVHPKDAERFSINLYQVRDLLNNYLP